MAGKDRMRTIKRNGESKLEQKLLTPASWDSGIKTVVIVVVVVVNVLFSIIPDFCVYVKRITLCNCLCSSSSSSSSFSRKFASVIRNIGKFGGKTYFTDHGTGNTRF